MEGMRFDRDTLRLFLELQGNPSLYGNRDSPDDSKRAQRSSYKHIQLEAMKYHVNHVCADEPRYLAEDSFSDYLSPGYLVVISALTKSPSDAVAEITQSFSGDIHRISAERDKKLAEKGLFGLVGLILDHPGEVAPFQEDSRRIDMLENAIAHAEDDVNHINTIIDDVWYQYGTRETLDTYRQTGESCEGREFDVLSARGACARMIYDLAVEYAERRFGYRVSPAAVPKVHPTEITRHPILVPA